MMEKSLLSKYLKSDKICPICNLYVHAKDIEDLNYIFSLTKKKKYIFAKRVAICYTNTWKVILS